MFKQLGITTLALAGLLGFAAPKKADARVRFGVYVGSPAYTYVPPAPAPAPYYAPDYYDNGYAAPAYAYPAPAYVQPYYAAPTYGFGLGFGGHDRDHWRHDEHFEHGFRGGEHGHGRR